jgi:hypothetical protein
LLPCAASTWLKIGKPWCRGFEDLHWTHEKIDNNNESVSHGAPVDTPLVILVGINQTMHDMMEQHERRCNGREGCRTRLWVITCTVFWLRRVRRALLLLSEVVVHDTD